MAFHIWDIQGQKARRVTETHQSVFGCRHGLIPKWVQQKYANKEVRGGDGFQWVLSKDEISGCLRQLYNTKNGALVIWANPNDENTVSWYRVVGIAGESGFGRTVMLVLLHNWATEKPRTSETEREITLPTPAEELMTFWYANGVFAADGRIEKTWNPPGPGSTNSVFIWPETMRFFRKIFPQAFPPSEEDQVANRLPVTD